MNKSTFDKEDRINQQPDKLSEEQQTEETISNELNTDDSVPGDNKLGEDPAESNPEEQLVTELNEAKDKYLRLVAEFDNFRRRNAKERMELIQTANKDLMQSLLVVLDDIERASRQMENSDDAEQIKEGVSLIFNKLHALLQSKGLKRMESIHQPFDPDLHDAIAEIPAPDENMKDKVVDETEPGYYLNDRIIRHAKVVVGK